MVGFPLLTMRAAQEWNCESKCVQEGAVCYDTQQICRFSLRSSFANVRVDFSRAPNRLYAILNIRVKEFIMEINDGKDGGWRMESAGVPSGRPL